MSMTPSPERGPLCKPACLQDIQPQRGPWKRQGGRGPRGPASIKMQLFRLELSLPLSAVCPWMGLTSSWSPRHTGLVLGWRGWGRGGSVEWGA